MNWESIKTEYINGSLSQREIAKKYGISFNKLQKEAKNGNWYSLKKRDVAVTEKKSASGLSSLSSLGDRLADKFALAVEQLGSDGEEIDTNRLRQLVGVMKDLTGIAENEEKASDNSEKKQNELVDIIKLALGVSEKDIMEDAKATPKEEVADIAT